MKKVSKRIRQVPAALAAAVAVTAVPAMAQPQGATVRAGNVNIQQSGAITNINQLSDRAIVDWQRFGIKANEVVNFLQPGAMSVILNRVTGQDPSVILGQLNANGQVWLLNPNGIVFGAGSQVNVGGLLASTLKISNEDFMAGKYNFRQDPSAALSAIVNQGTITISDGGYAILSAPMVSQEGLIVANLGKVVLAAGEKMTVNFDGRNLVNFKVDPQTGTPGTVLLQRDMVNNLLSQIITNNNVVEAGSAIKNPDGSISLVRGSGVLSHTGTTKADGAEGVKAGQIDLHSTQATYVGGGSVVSTVGKGKNSDGGRQVIWSDGRTVTEAGSLMTARQGDASGKGGFIENSGKQSVILRGQVDPGEGGTFLLDPRYLTILSGSGGTLPGPNVTFAQGGQTESISEATSRRCRRVSPSFWKPPIRLPSTTWLTICCSLPLG
jgi:filamentous hemagglutinin family protein